MLGLASIVLVTAASVIIGVWGVKAARSTPDFLVASRRIVPGWHALAIAGEYVSAASGRGGIRWRWGISPNSARHGSWRSAPASTRRRPSFGGGSASTPMHHASSRRAR